MILADLHCHTRFSHDSIAEPIEVIKKAIDSGVGVLALTDHMDIDAADYGMKLNFDIQARKNELLELKEKYRKDIKIIYGIELGQPYNAPESAQKVINQGDFEFVIGSVHNLKNMPDFYYIDFSKMRADDENCFGLVNNIYSRYLDDVYKLTELPYIDTVAHCTYPYRYMYLGGFKLDFKPFYPKYEQIFKSIVKNGKWLEINTSNIRRGYGFTMPDADILQIYKDCGGKFVTLGADAHRPHEVGADIDVGYKLAGNLGLEVITDIKEKY